MALVKYGGGIVQMSGSIAGTTHARNRFGNYARARTKPVNPKSARQVAARIAVMYLAEQWRESPMTDVIRTAWQTYANSVDWHNKLGEIVSLTGFNHFIRSNAARLAANVAVITAAPTDLGLPAGDPVFLCNTFSAGLQNFNIIFDDGMDWCDEDGAYLMIDFGEPQNATRNFFDGPWRYQSAVSGSSVAPPVSPILGASFHAWTLVEGQKLWIRAQIVRADARLSTKFESAPQVIGA